MKCVQRQKERERDELMYNIRTDIRICCVHYVKRHLYTRKRRERENDVCITTIATHSVPYTYAYFEHTHTTEFRLCMRARSHWKFETVRIILCVFSFYSKCQIQQCVATDGRNTHVHCHKLYCVHVYFSITLNGKHNQKNAEDSIALQ